MRQRKRSAIWSFISLALAFFLAISYASAQLPNQTSDNQKYIAFRPGLGYQGSTFISPGVMKLWSYPSKGVFGGSAAIYSALEWNISSHLPMYGIKSGFETSWGPAGWGVELKYLTDFSQGNLMLTPKAGINLGGFFILYYGYNLFNEDAKLAVLSHHQVECSIALSKRILNGHYQKGK